MLVIIVNYLFAGPRHESAEDRIVNRIGHKVHRPIEEDELRTAGMVAAEDPHQLRNPRNLIVENRRSIVEISLCELVEFPIDMSSCFRPITAGPRLIAAPGRPVQFHALFPFVAV